MRLFRRMGAPLLAALVVLASSLPAAARLLIEIDKSNQRMIVSQDGAQLYVWPVSTGLPRYDTPSGQYTPFRMEKDHFSREWDDAPMPHSIFFTKKGHAIHGTTHLNAIGRPASHGCVRLEPENAQVLFGLVRQEGMANTRVVLTGVPPDPRAPAIARREPGYGEPPENYSYRERPGFYRDRPGYVTGGSADNEDLAPRTRDPRGGYWVQRPDGSQMFVDRERMAPPPPPAPPFFFGRPPGWN